MVRISGPVMWIDRMRQDGMVRIDMVRIEGMMPGGWMIGVDGIVRIYGVVRVNRVARINYRMRIDRGVSHGWSNRHELRESIRGCQDRTCRDGHSISVPHMRSSPTAIEYLKR